MQRFEQIYEEKAKKVFETDAPGLVVNLKNNATVFNDFNKGLIRVEKIMRRVADYENI